MSVTESIKPQTHEEKLEKLTAEVQALREQIKKAQRLATIGTMTAMIVHEFNNILTPIINYARLARENPELIPKAIACAEDGGQRATDICRAILGIAREEASEPAEVNVSQLLNETVSAMARGPRKDGIELEVRVPADLTIITRRVELQQVILNLLINARAAVLEKPGQRRIELSAQRENKEVLIRVADNGIGVPPENIERIFDPFFTTKNGDSAGHGLGLAICKDIITSLGGQILVESTPGEGATFTIRLTI